MNGINPKYESNQQQNGLDLAFPAHVAAYNGDLDHIKLLVEQGVININERDDKGSTMAHKAAGQGHLHVLQWLIENGADMRVMNESGESAQDVARRFAQLAAFKMLESVTGLDQQDIDGDDDDKDDPRRSMFMSESKEAESSVQLSGRQRKDAKFRARARLQEIEKQLVIARSNYVQLGGRLEEVVTGRDEFTNEQRTIK